MKTHQKIIAFTCAAAFVTATCAAEYHPLTRYHIGGEAGRVDYLRVDPVNHHLFVAHDKVFHVVDLDSGKTIGEIGPAARAHGIAIVPGLNRGFATSGNTNAIIMFDLKTLQTISVIQTSGKNPDGVEYDPETKRVYVANGSTGNISIIDPAQGKVVDNITVTSGKGSKLEAMGFDGAGRIFVNDEDMTSTHVIDLKTRKVLTTWSLAPGEGGTGMAVDREHHRIFSSCANKKLIILDSDTGKVVATPAIGDDPDAVFYDPSTQNIFVTCLDSTMTVLHEDTPDAYSTVQVVATGPGAKTGTFDDGKVYLPVMQFDNKPGPRPGVIPGTLDIIVIGK
jgi:DNA-binding beta-propeller fold protein YncE